MWSGVVGDDILLEETKVFGETPNADTPTLSLHFDISVTDKAASAKLLLHPNILMKTSVSTWTVFHRKLFEKYVPWEKRKNYDTC